MGICESTSAPMASRRTTYNQSGMPDETISASLLALFLFDVSDEIRLDDIRSILDVPQAARKPAFRQPAPEYVQFASPPVLESIEGLTLSDGRCVGGQVA